MDTIGKLEKFMKFLCKNYEIDNVLKSHGKGPLQLVGKSGIDFGDARAQLAAMDMLLGQDLIEAVDLRGIKQKGVKHISSYTKIRPSYKGLQSRRQDWTEIVSAMAEGGMKGIIKGFTQKMKNAIVYCRVSTEDQEREGASRHREI